MKTGNDPMTEGAKTGTPRKLCLYCQYPVANKKEWDEIPGGEGDHLCWGECNERNDVDSLLRKSRSDLTEALKVAGEDKRDAERYRFLRDAACRDHKHHTQQSFSVAKAGWADELNPEKKSNNPFWLHKEMTGSALDAEVDAALERIRNKG